jgi:hypothetical protein
MCIDHAYQIKGRIRKKIINMPVNFTYISFLCDTDVAIQSLKSSGPKGRAHVNMIACFKIDLSTPSDIYTACCVAKYKAVDTFSLNFRDIPVHVRSLLRKY